MFSRCLLALCVGSMMFNEAHARRLPDWPHDKLAKEADVVVIAKAGKTVTTKDDIGATGWKSKFLGQETELDVLHVVAGKCGEKPIQLLHFRLAEDHAILNGPTFIALESGDKYLLYLKRRDDGRFEPVSGRIDPSLSVFALKGAPRSSDTPVAPAKKPAFEATLTIDSNKSIHDEKSATVFITNNTKEDLELRTNLPFGALVFLDTEILNDKDKRVSAKHYWAMISSPFDRDDSMSAGTIPAGKSLTIPVRLFLTVDERDRFPGKYTCRVRFKYKMIEALSEPVPAELTEANVKKP